MACPKAELTSVIKNRPIYNLHTKVQLQGGGVGIDTIFYNIVSHVSWYSLDPVQYTCSTSNDSEGNTICTYEPPPGYHYAVYTYIGTQTPAMKVKDEYSDSIRIGMCRSPIAQIVTEASCKIDKIFTIQEFDGQWLHWYPEFYLKHGHESSHKRDAGNITELQDKSLIVPKAKLSMMQPWYYSNKSHTAFPLFLLGSQTKFIHSYTYNLKLDHLIQMDELVNGVWRMVVPDPKYVEGIPSDGSIQVPSMHGLMGFIDDPEIAYHNGKPYRFLAETIYGSSSDDPSRCTSRTPVKADLDKEGNCLAIFWAAANMTGLPYNVHANYTTSLTDPINGASPIKDSTLKYKTEKFKDLGGEHTSGPLLYHHFRRSPSINGLNAFSFCYNSLDIHAKVGVMLNDLKAVLKVNLSDPETTRWKNGKSDLRGDHESIPPPCSDEFHLIVRMLMQKEFIIDNYVVTDVFDEVTS